MAINLSAYKNNGYNLINPPPFNKSKTESQGSSEVSINDRYLRILSELNAIRIDSTIRDTETEDELAVIQEMIVKIAKGENISEMFAGGQGVQTQMLQGNFAPPVGSPSVPSSEVMRIQPGMYGAY